MTFSNRRPSETFVSGDDTWLGSEHGTDSPYTITLDPAKFTLSTHAPDGFYRSGTPLGKVTATQMYGPYDNTATDGRETLAGHLYKDVPAPPAGATGGEPASLFWHGRVRTSRLPLPVDAAGQADVAGRIHYTA